MTDIRRVLVTGSRTWTDEDRIAEALLETWREALRDGADGILLVHGACPSGADALAAGWAAANEIPTETHPAHDHPAQDFGTGPGAGPDRNRYMVGLGADVALAFIAPCASPRCRRAHPHPSHGASGCAHLAEQAGIPTRRYTA